MWVKISGRRKSLDWEAFGSAEERFWYSSRAGGRPFLRVGRLRVVVFWNHSFVTPEGFLRCGCAGVVAVRVLRRVDGSLLLVFIFLVSSMRWMLLRGVLYSVR